MSPLEFPEVAGQGYLLRGAGYESVNYGINNIY